MKIPGCHVPFMRGALSKPMKLEVLHLCIDFAIALSPKVNDTPLETEKILLQMGNRTKP